MMKAIVYSNYGSPMCLKSRRWTKIQLLDRIARPCHQIAVGGAGDKPEGRFLCSEFQA
jgi:hypothetical protein